MIRTILLWPDDSLKARCDEVLLDGALLPGVVRLLNDLEETMLAAGGLGLAAPQVGVRQRLVVAKDKETGQVYKLINPRLVEADSMLPMEEGCLSMPGWYTPVKRAVSVRVDARTPEGAAITIHARGRLAQALQHELEHLDGVMRVTEPKVRRGNDFQLALKNMKRRYPMGTWLPVEAGRAP